MKLEFENGHSSEIGSEPGSYQHKKACVFSSGERIINVTVFITYEGTYKFVNGLNVRTSLGRVCEFGGSSAESAAVSGHQLLYLSGRKSFFLDGIEAHFDYDCD